MKTRCSWVKNDPMYINYHDNEWGMPIYDERLLFEFLILEGMQAGLNWLTILKKRDNYRLCFDNFDAEMMVKYGQNQFADLMANQGIVRNKLKIQAAISNAMGFLQIKQEWNSFSSYIWHFVDYRPIINHWENSTLVPSTSDISKILAIDLKKYGFKFVGSTICYAFMQAVGMVNDHTTNCFCYKEK